MKRFIKVNILLVILMLVFSGLVGFAQEEKVITYARGEDILFLDPYNHTSLVNYMINWLIYDRLVEWNDDVSGFNPALATEWSISPEGDEYTFKLRDDVYFHNGEHFNAESVKVSIERFLHETLAQGADWKTLKGVEIIDDYTVTIKYTEPNAVCLNTLAATEMLPPKAFKEKGTALFDEGIGTGAFTFTEWSHGEYIVVEKNPDYWGKEAYADKIVYRTINEISTRLSAVQVGQIDVADSMPAEQVPMIEADPNLENVNILTWDQLYISQSWMHTEDSPFDDIRFREAISLAIDREGLVEYVFRGGRVASGIIPARLPGFDENKPPLKYDMERAKQLVEESNYDGRELFLVAPAGWYPKIKDIAEFIQASLGEAGIKVRVELVEGAKFVEIRSAGTYDLYCSGFGHIGDIDLFMLQRIVDDTTGTGYVNERLNDLILQQNKIVDVEERAEMIREIENLINTEVAPFIFLFQMDTNQFVRRGLKGVRWFPSKTPDLRYVHYDEWL